MTLLTTTYDPATHKLAPIEPTDEMASIGLLHVMNDDATIVDVWGAMLSAAPAAPSGWLPIESAPKDGSYILLAMGGEVSRGRYDSGRHAKPTLPYFTCDIAFLMGIKWARENQPCVWHPLPQPPAHKE
jgi:hypothetical protein